MCGLIRLWREWREQRAYKRFMAQYGPVMGDLIEAFDAYAQLVATTVDGIYNDVCAAFRLLGNTLAVYQQHRARQRYWYWQRRRQQQRQAAHPLRAPGSQLRPRGTR